MKLLLHPAVDAQRLARIREAGTPHLIVVNAQTQQEALSAIADADGFFGKITPELLSRSTRLRWIQSPTASLEHYMFAELVEHPAVLTNMRGLYYDVIADQVLGYILCFARNLHTYIRRQMEHRYEPVGGEASRTGFLAGPSEVTPMYVAHRHLEGETLGIIGLGSIGGEIARRGQAFGLKILAVDPLPQDPPEGVTLWGVDRLHDLLAASDWVVVAAPHTPQTEGLFQRPLFQKMKRSAYFINIGRGAIVSLDALVQALDAGEIAGAALDVFEIEPLPPDHPLWDKENVIITPHIAGYSPRIPERHLSTLLENVGRFARGETLLNVTRKREWY